ncbi:MAG: hypothetical protein ACP5IG_02895 [Candidatus Micrarchaeia archaeon]
MTEKKEVEEVERKVAEELAKRFNYNPKKLNELCAFVAALHDFSHQLQENRYYSEALAKKVFELTLEFDAISLEVEGLRMRSRQLEDEIETSLLAKRKPAVNAMKGTQVKKEVEEAWENAMKAHAKLERILSEIRSEYKRKTFNAFFG